MKRALMTASALSMAAGTASADLDRSYQDISALFNAPGTASLSFGVVQPSVKGKDALGNSYDVGENFSRMTLSYTNAISDVFGYTVIVDQPYGADVSYNNDPMTSTLGGTGADLDSTALTFLGRYKANNRLSFHGGISIQRITAEVALNGTAYANAISANDTVKGFNATRGTGVPALDIPTLAEAAGAAARVAAAVGAGSAPATADLVTVGTFDATYVSNTLGAGGATPSGPIVDFGGARAAFQANDGYDFELDESIAVQPVIGMAYEIPDIALRFAATYFFETDHSSKTEENINGTNVDGDVDFVTPQALNLDFQTGIATDTLLTASYRWAQYSAVDIVPDRLQSDLVNLDDSRRYTLGVARRFNDAWAASITFNYTLEGEDELVSPLGPTNGQRGVTIGARYENGGLVASAGYNYTRLGDARAEVGGTEQASFEDNYSRGLGFRINYQF